AHRPGAGPWHRTSAEPTAIRAWSALTHRPLGQLEPQEVVRAQGEQVRQLADPGEVHAADQLDRHAAREAREVELDVLRKARQVGDAQDLDSLVLAQVGEHAAVLGTKEGLGAPAEDRVRLAHADDPLHPVEQRNPHSLLRLDAY